MHLHFMRKEHLLTWDLAITKKVIGKTVMLTLLSGWAWTVKAEEVLIRPSVWGTEKWPGGYDLFAGYRKVGEAKASEWGQTKWYGGYELKLDENDKKVFESALRNILNK